ncbi:MAG: DUF853 family protein, partial [Candidatus Methanomethylophilaceae archaeon]|nr:DUF853 family protein [Candidatus Methanomethylophilaceae archaeon]
MYSDGKVWIAKGDERVYLLPRMANRHGLITGASGTGKTVTMRVLAESFSDAGVPVFFSDMKGDVGGVCNPGEDTAKMRGRAEKLGAENFEFKGFPTVFWDVYGECGHPVRTTVSSLGASLLSRLLDLTSVQSDVLAMVFRLCKDKGWDLIDSKDLVSVLQYVSKNRADYTAEYGNMSAQTLGAIQRSVRTLEDEGGDFFFGEPALDIFDWIRTGENGKGVLNVLNSMKLSRSPKLYSTFMMWLIQELFERLPEAGDPEKPKLVFFFDEAHMLFSDAPKPVIQNIEQMVKLIRSKGVGIYFVSQSPSDIPDSVLAQLSNRVQHALRAYTPAEQKSVRAAASSFRVNEKFKTEIAITELGVGEALVSCLDEKGIPSIVERAFILPPQSSLSPLSDAEYQNIIKSSVFESKYRERIERQSAFETILKLNEDQQKEEAKAAEAKAKAAPKSSGS